MFYWDWRRQFEGPERERGDEKGECACVRERDRESVCV